MKLLIVDDDIYTREGLAETIPWNLYGIDDVMQTEYLKDAIDLSAVAFIEKPIQPEAVMEALEKAVGKI